MKKQLSPSKEYQRQCKGGGKLIKSQITNKNQANKKVLTLCEETVQCTEMSAGAEEERDCGSQPLN